MDIIDNSKCATSELNCCHNLLKQNKKLKLALEKEKNRRRKIENAFKKLLNAYNSVVNITNSCNTSSSSFFASDSDEEQKDDSNYSEKENFRNYEKNFKDDKENKKSQILIETKNVLEEKKLIQNKINKEISFVQKQHDQSDKINLEKTKPLKFNEISLLNSKPLQKNLENAKLKKNLNDLHSYVNKNYLNNKNDVINLIYKDSVCQLLKKNQPKQEWYFLALDNREDIEEKALKRQYHLENWLQRSAKRMQAILKTSQRRAQIVARRRTVAVEILRGQRKLDQEALKILHTDSSIVSSFPDKFMQDMKLLSKKKFIESEKRFEQERGNLREKRLQMATNKILAQTSATITKCVTNVQFNKKFLP